MERLFISAQFNKRSQSMTDFIPLVLEPFIRIAKQHKGDVKALFGNSVIFRSVFSEWFDKDGMKLETLPAPEKALLWKESSELCPDDRINWCKAVKFYESF